MTDTSKKEIDYAELVDLRLAPIAEAVKAGQVVERHWEFFKTTYFPNMSDMAAQATLLAWAGRNGIKASLLTSYTDANEAPRVSHVRLTQLS